MILFCSYALEFGGFDYNSGKKGRIVIKIGLDVGERGGKSFEGELNYLYFSRLGNWLKGRFLGFYSRFVNLEILRVGFWNFCRR